MIKNHTRKSERMLSGERKKGSFIEFITRLSENLIFNKQIQTLTKTRDALLPKLMSGQIRVKD